MSQWHIPLDIDSILQAQGADPQSIRMQSPRLLHIAEQALMEAKPLLHPQVYLKRLKVLDQDAQELFLHDGGMLTGPLIAERLSSATEIVAVLCTIGPELEKRSTELMPMHTMRALALDGAGSAAVEILCNAACSSVEKQARSEQLHISMPFFPGMHGWPIEVGQDQLFNLWDEPLDIMLTPSYMMVPRKSLSMVVGLGKRPFQSGSSCNLCSSSQTCRYRDLHAQ
ncbi:MAG TPA: hypothetical protein G4O08_06935 [Anaerolineae bacterium]|nr:hypothetical protein [Anaerolineae bacterium]